MIGVIGFSGILAVDMWANRMRLYVSKILGRGNCDSMLAELVSYHHASVIYYPNRFGRNLYLMEWRKHAAVRHAPIQKYGDSLPSEA